MSDALHAPCAHQFDSADQQRATVTLGMWAFLVTEILFFGGIFLGYAVYRYLYPAAFHEGSAHLDLVLGTANTVVLLASSLTMALAVRAASHGARRAAVALLALTMLLGAGFLGVKAVEYAHKAQDGMLPGRAFHGHAADPNVRIFYSFYFVLTGMHALHMVIGLALLGILAALAARGRFGSAYYTPVETAGLYWHFVDVVWIFLFPLLYLVG